MSDKGSINNITLPVYKKIKKELDDSVSTLQEEIDSIQPGTKLYKHEITLTNVIDASGDYHFNGNITMISINSSKITSLSVFYNFEHVSIYGWISDKSYEDYYGRCIIYAYEEEGGYGTFYTSSNRGVIYLYRTGTISDTVTEL